VGKAREGQTKGLLYGAKLAKFPIIVTIDSDLENPPEFIPEVVAKLRDVDVVVASRRVLPRFSERWAIKRLVRCVMFPIFTPTLGLTSETQSLMLI
jgi:hypothetical protein